MSKVRALYHIVWCTKHREMTLTNECREDIYRMIWYEVKKKNCMLKRVGGIPNHLHLLIDLHPSEALADVVGSVKASISAWLKRDGRFPQFQGWAREYYASSISPKAEKNVIAYIDGQQYKHLNSGSTLDDELLTLYKYIGVEYETTEMTE